MIDSAPPPPFAAVVVAAGKGQRAGGHVPKQFANWRGKPLIRHCVDTLTEHGCELIVLVVPEGMHEAALDAAGRQHKLLTVDGGATRQLSVRAGLEKLSAFDPDRVLIHDAARPIIPSAVIDRLIEGLDTSSGVIPVLPVVDSVVLADDGLMVGKAERDDLRRVQTPQAFRFKDILAAHRSWVGEPSAGDDAQVLAASGAKVALVAGDEALKKITFAEDLMADTPEIRVGQGYDVHRLAEGEELWLCGVKIPHEKGLSGHSDADAALHSIVDALLGAIGQGDIGTHFPPSDPRWKGAASPLFVEHAMTLVEQAGYRICNLDLTLICEEPKIGSHRETMRARLAELLRVDVEQLSVKATTTERLGFTGRGEGIAAQALVSLQRN